MQTASDNLRRARPLLGTFVEIAAWGAASAHATVAIEAAFDAVARVHGLMSFHDPESDVSRLNREAKSGAVAVDPWTIEVLAIAQDLHRRSGGAFDITVAPALQSLGLLPAAQCAAAGQREAATQEHPPHVIAGLDVIELLPSCRVRFRRPGTRIDLGGIAKGFAVDRTVAVLKEHGIPQGLVNAGGDLAAFGPEPQLIHIRDPRDPLRLLGAVALFNEALASSAAHSNGIESIHARSAIIDPRTGRPANLVKGASVRAPSCVTADALTKAVMIEGEASAPLLDHYGASAVIVLGDDDICLSSNWKDNSLAA
ncbi:MAG TPA: FAD:protein FMN transferase [Xanthobacteraceae bacterium]|jgi:thiamine biosynthesis lipoprotein